MIALSSKTAAGTTHALGYLLVAVSMYAAVAWICCGTGVSSVCWRRAPESS